MTLNSFRSQLLITPAACIIERIIVRRWPVVVDGIVEPWLRSRRRCNGPLHNCPPPSAHYPLTLRLANVSMFSSRHVQYRMSELTRLYACNFLRVCFSHYVITCFLFFFLFLTCYFNASSLMPYVSNN